MITNIAWRTHKDSNDFRNTSIYYYLNNYFINEILQFEKEKAFEVEEISKNVSLPAVDEIQDPYLKMITDTINEANSIKYDGNLNDISVLTYLASNTLLSVKKVCIARIIPF